jgi:hypothetical protein
MFDNWSNHSDTINSDTTSCATVAGMRPLYLTAEAVKYRDENTIGVVAVLGLDLRRQLRASALPRLRRQSDPVRGMEDGSFAPDAQRRSGTRRSWSPRTGSSGRGPGRCSSPRRQAGVLA